MAGFSQKIGLKKGVVDHPFSPFVNLTIEEMKEAGEAGLWLNFTFDELSPLLGIDPANMYKAIRTVGPEHCTLSSDAGEPLFPNSVESLRLLRGYMAAFGCTADEIYTVHSEPVVHRRTKPTNGATGGRGALAEPRLLQIEKAHPPQCRRTSLFVSAKQVLKLRWRHGKFNSELTERVTSCTSKVYIWRCLWPKRK